jgi:hypothetical protein
MIRPWIAAQESAMEQGVQIAKWLSGPAKKLLRLAPALPYVGQAFGRAGPFYFSIVRSQFICVDDLERRGSGLSLKDVFGLISFLREQRACKIALLLNVDALAEEERSEFDTLFEKVIDAQLIFSPSAEEATQIALARKDDVTEFLRKYCVALNISNIRVIKKIERLIRQIVPLLSQLAPELTQQTVHSITLFGWTKFQPKLAPPFEFYRTSSIARYLDHKDGKEFTEEERRWNDALDRYQFRNMDDFDLALAKFVDTGVLDSTEISTEASKQNEKVKLTRESNALEAAWRPFHDFIRRKS